ncbi:hypothetical protein CDS [Bradyrhizobium sp.]|nr:hypothetical protein CDS [Bradyrhizobium sp.]
MADLHDDWLPRARCRAPRRNHVLLKISSSSLLLLVETNLIGRYLLADIKVAVKRFEHR